MPRGRRRMRGGAVPDAQFSQVGGSGFTDFFTKSIPHFFTKDIPKAAKTVYSKGLVPLHDIVKKNHLISSGLALVPHPGAKAAGLAARIAGYGKRKPKRVIVGGRKPRRGKAVQF